MKREGHLMERIADPDNLRLAFWKARKGLPFLGYVLFPDRVRLNKHSKNRFVRKYKHYQNMLTGGAWTQEQYALHVQLPVAIVERRVWIFSNKKQKIRI